MSSISSSATASRRRTRAGTHPPDELWDHRRQRGEPGRVHGQFCWIDRDARVVVVGSSSFPVQSHPLLSASLGELWSTVRAALAP